MHSVLENIFVVVLTFCNLGSTPHGFCIKIIIPLKFCASKSPVGNTASNSDHVINCCHLSFQTCSNPSAPNNNLIVADMLIGLATQKD